MTEEFVPEVCPLHHDLRTGWYTLLFGGVIVTGLTWYCQHNYITDEYLVVNAAALLFLPMLLIMVVLKQNPSDYGFCPAGPGTRKPAWLFFLGMLPIILVVQFSKEFQQTYPLRQQAAFDWGQLLYWELSYGLYMFCWEFFYRGFLTFGLKRAFGATAAIILQTIAFGIMHWGKPMPEFYGSFIAGALLGWLAIRGRSFVPCFAVHFGVSLCFDLLAIHHKIGGLF